MGTKTIAKKPSERWGPERRREFIDFRLRWEGKINRVELVEHFGISTQQASADLAHYGEIAPNNLAYDKSAKTYKAAPTFYPLSVASDARHYLGQLMDIASGTASNAGSFIGWVPPCDVVRYPARPVDTQNLLKLLWAIRDGEDIRVTYQSMRRPSAEATWITPHAFGSDGLRWHVRAWCHEEGEFRDFVLSRILSIMDARKTAIDPRSDALWFSRIDIVIQPRDGLTTDQRRAVEIDYGMKKGRLVINCRKAQVWYVLRQLHLDQLGATSVLEQPLEYKNTPELQVLIAAARKRPERSLKHLSNRRVKNV